MSASHRLILLVVSGLLLCSGLTAVAIERLDPAQASGESPLLQVSTARVTTTTTTLPPETVPPETTTTAAPAPVVKPAPRSGGPVVPPRNSYAPEPIMEIGRIEIPKIGLDHKVMHGITLRNIDHGPSHWPGTPLPGEQGNTVFAGHRVTHSRPFYRINELVPGDEIFFSVAGVRSRYVVTGHEIVAPSRVDIVNPTPDPIVTIFACHPRGSARQRYVVRGALSPLEGSAPAPPAPEPAPAQEPAPQA